MNRIKRSVSAALATVLIAAVAAMALPLVTYAEADLDNGLATPSDSEVSCTGESNPYVEILPTWYKYLEREEIDGVCHVDFDILDADDAAKIGLAIFEILMRIAGMVAVAFVIYGGFLYITSAGEPEKARNGRTTIINALIGLGIALFATAIVSLFGRGLTGGS